MTLSTKHRIFFVIIILSFALGMLFLVLASLLLSQDVIRRAWAPNTVQIIRQAVIGSPSSIASEVQAIVRPREDVPLPVSDLMFDIGFRPEPDGFSFCNYGTRFPAGNLTMVEAYELFGDAICAIGSGPDCTPSPSAQMWVDTMNDYMADGHCAGFTVASRRFFDDQLFPSDFYVTAQTTYNIDQNVPAMRQIAKDWSMQVTEEVWQSRVDGTPREVLDALLALRQLVDLGIFGRNGGGHSLLAFGVQDMGDGFYHILVYDNNWPGQELFIEVDYKANTWRYSLAATSPTEDAAAWEGDARSRTMMFIPFSVYDVPVTCPFCGTESPSGQKTSFTFVSLTGDEGLLQVENDQDQRLGQYEDGFINEMADGRLVRLKDYMYNDRAPYLTMRGQPDFRVRVLPRPGKKIADANLRMGSAGFAFAVDGLTLASGQFGDIFVSPKNGQVVFSSNDKTKPKIKMTTELAGKSTIATVGDATIPGGETLNVALDPETGNMVIGGQEADSSAASADDTQVTESDDTVVLLYPDDTLEFQYPDGTVEKLLPDGTRITVFLPSGMVKVEASDGTVTLQYPDGTAVRQQSDGTVEML